MNVQVCPHCKAHRIVTTKVPRDVVVVMPCPACHELMVLFRNKVIALDRDVLENGSFEQRKTHLAHVIAEFIEPGMFAPLDAEAIEDLESFKAEDALPKSLPRRRRKKAADAAEPISDEELDRFVHIDLKRLDDPAYFKKHFG